MLSGGEKISSSPCRCPLQCNDPNDSLKNSVSQRQMMSGGIVIQLQRGYAFSVSEKNEVSLNSFTRTGHKSGSPGVDMVFTSVKGTSKSPPPPSANRIDDVRTNWSSWPKWFVCCHTTSTSALFSHARQLQFMPRQDCTPQGHLLYICSPKLCFTAYSRILHLYHGSGHYGVRKLALHSGNPTTICRLMPRLPTQYDLS